MTRRKDPATAEKLANSIRSLRKSKYSGHGGQKNAYTAFGVDGTIWSRWESGRSAPDDVNQRKLAKFFGVSLAELRGDHVEVPPDYLEHFPGIANNSVALLVGENTALKNELRLKDTRIEEMAAIIAVLEGEDRSRPAARKRSVTATKPTKANKRPRKK